MRELPHRRQPASVLRTARHRIQRIRPSLTRHPRLNHTGVTAEQEQQAHAAISRLIGEYCGLSDKQLRQLELGAPLHDIGKIAIPRNVLMKPSKLTNEEWRVMKEHPAIGHHVLTGFPELTEEAEVIFSHHETYDDSGYPQGLNGERIPLGARIFSIVDTFDAITSDRPHRTAQSVNAARNEIGRVSGQQFDPKLVNMFLGISPEELHALLDQYPDQQG